MSAKIIPFPKVKRAPVVYAIPLYGEEEVSIALAAINIFGPKVTNDPPTIYATRTTLKYLKPHIVVEILNLAYRSDIFAAKGKDILKRIISNIEMDKPAKAN